MVETHIDISSKNQGSGSSDYELTSPNGTIEVVTTEDGHEIEVSSDMTEKLDELVGLQTGLSYAVKASIHKRKFADLYWTNANGALTYHKYYHAIINRVMGGRYDYQLPIRHGFVLW